LQGGAAALGQLAGDGFGGHRFQCSEAERG
jgi:hypothetical protein